MNVFRYVTARRTHGRRLNQPLIRDVLASSMRENDMPPVTCHGCMGQMPQ